MGALLGFSIGLRATTPLECFGLALVSAWALTLCNLMWYVRTDGHLPPARDVAVGIVIVGRRYLLWITLGGVLGGWMR
jgi:hypothetical protein